MREEVSRGALGDLLLIILLMALSGNQVLTGEGRGEPALIAAAALVVLLFVVRGRRPFTVRYWLVAIGFALVFLVQAVTFGFLPVVTVGGFFLRMFVGYGIVRLVRDFPTSYVRTIYLVSLLSLLFFLPVAALSFYGYDWRAWLEPLRRLSGIEGDYHIIIHNYDIEASVMRNASFFWEPGAFAGYLILGILLLGTVRDGFSRHAYRLTLVVLSLTVLTTLTTAGFILLPLALTTHLWFKAPNIRRARGRVLTGLLVLIVLCGFYLWSSNVSFMKEKILQQYRNTTDRVLFWDKTRFGTLIFDLEYIKAQPLFGWGLHPATRYSLHPEMDISGHGNDLSGMPAKFGFVGFALFVVSVYLGVRSAYGPRRSLRSVAVTLMIVLTMFGEAFSNFPLYLGLMFFSLHRPKAFTRMISTPLPYALRPPDAGHPAAGTPAHG